MRRFTQIVGLSADRRIPRIGKIRLGIKKKHPQSGKEYPVEVDYFLLHPPAADDPPSAHDAFEKFVEVYGDKPKELEVVIPSEDRSVVFPQRYKCYGSSTGLKCVGDGQTAERVGAALGKSGDEATEFFEVPCPSPSECDFAEKHGCRPIGSLFVMLPRVSLGGCFQIDVGGINSIISINSALDHIRALCGRTSGILVPDGDGGYRSPLFLKRVPFRTQGGGRVSVHYLVAIEPRLTVEDLAKLRTEIAPSRPEQRPALPPAGEEGGFGEETSAGEGIGVEDDEPTPEPAKPDPWKEIERLFEVLNVPPKMRSSYKEGYRETPEDLLKILRRKAKAQGLDVEEAE